MSDTVKLVQGDADVDIEVTLTDQSDGSAIDISAADVLLFYRKVGASALTATVVCTKPGAIGKVIATLPAVCMAESGAYVGEFQLTTGSKIQTVNQKQKFRVREQLEV